MCIEVGTNKLIFKSKSNQRNQYISNQYDPSLFKKTNLLDHPPRYLTLVHLLPMYNMGQIRESERKIFYLKREKISEKVLFVTSHIFATKEKITFYQMNSNSRLKVGKKYIRLCLELLI